MTIKALLSENNLLIGNYIQLEPLSEDHREGLRKAANYESIWCYMPHRAINELFDPWFDDQLDKMNSEEQLSYVIRQSQSQLIIGATAYYDIQPENQRLALGYTWISPDEWGGLANSESKLLMLEQAFERWGINRVEIGADSRNSRSCHAIKKLGAKEEGILRQHMILHDGVMTDTIVFSILLSEWPGIKGQLLQRLRRLNSGS